MQDIKLAQNFSSLGLMVYAVGVAQILRSTATATATAPGVTYGKNFFAQIMFLSHKKY
jgi:hypothetical protein